MQVVILCGGFGTRIRDVADDIPKPMIPIGNHPILWHIMKGYAHQGFNDFILCLGYKSWIVKRYFLDYHLAQSDFTFQLNTPEVIERHGPSSSENWRITFAETGLDSMTGCRIKRIEKYIHEDHFMVTYGDGVSNVDLRALATFHQSHGKVGTVTTVQPPGRFGELDLAGDQVSEFCEKPLAAPGWISGGYFVFHRKIFERLDDDPELVLEREPLKNLAYDNQLMAYRHRGFWHPMDNSRDYKYLNDLFAEKQAPWMIWQPQLQRLPSTKAA
jgi:glucose-1-phosphate cytidylyltransferase